MMNGEKITMRCQFCERLFVGTRPVFLSERTRATCPACRAEAVRNTEEMERRERNALLNQLKIVHNQFKLAVTEIRKSLMADLTDLLNQISRARTVPGRNTREMERHKPSKGERDAA